MGRFKKHNTPYSGDKEQLEAVFQEYMSCIVDCFGAPYDDRKEGCGANSLRFVYEEFNISIPKARKILITAGVYSTSQSRQIAELSAQGRNLKEIMAITGLSRSSVSSYLPYQKYSYNMEEASRHAIDSRKYRERKNAVKQLHEMIIENGDRDSALWKTVLAYQSYPFRTVSGFPFSYTVKCTKNGEYSGELIVSRKEGSKTLTKGSIMLAFHTVLENMTIADITDTDGGSSVVLVPPEYKGPKEIGQIFGISYLYSMFWKWGLINVPGTGSNGR